MAPIRIIARGLLYTTAAVSALIVVQSALAGERCYIEQTQPAAAPATVIATPAKPAKRTGRAIGKRKAIKADAARISALARRPVAQTTLVEVPCARPSDFVPALGPVVPYAWELPPTFDPTTDWFAQHVGPVPAPRTASVPIAGTLPLFMLGAAAAWCQRRS